MKIKKSALLGCAYLEALAEKNPTLVSNDNIRLTYESGNFIWVINTSIYQVVAIVAENSESQDITDLGKDFDVGVKTSKFFSTIKALTDDEVTIEATERGLIISDSNLKVTLPVLAVEEMTPMIEPDTDNMEPYKSIIFSDVGKLSAFTATDNTTLSGVTIRQNKDTLDFFASDRTTVYRATQTFSEERSEYKFILPTELLVAIGKINLLKDSLVYIGTYNEGSAIAIVWKSEQGEGMITSRVIAGTTPNFDNLFNNLPTSRLGFNAGELLNAVRLYDAITELNNITLEFKDDTIFISGPGFFKMIPSVDAIVAKDVVNVSLDTKRLIAVLSVFREQDTLLRVDNQKTYIVLSNGKETVGLAKVRRF